MRRTVFRCPVCGGVDISARAWVNPNFPPKGHQDVDWIDEPDVFCCDCMEDYKEWDDSVELQFDDDGLVVTDDGRHITLEEWAEENHVGEEDE